MNTFPIGMPPKTAGIYALKCKSTGQLYIGKSVNLHRRYSEWRAVFATGLGAKSFATLEIALKGDPADWDFVVVQEVDETEDLAEMERRAIARLRTSCGGKLLNVICPVKPQNHRAIEYPTDCVAKTEMIGPDGKKISYGHAAELLGISRETLKKRLQKQRARGCHRYDLRELEKFRTPKDQMLPSRNHQIT